MQEGQEKSYGFNLAAQTHGRDVAEMPTGLTHGREETICTDVWEGRVRVVLGGPMSV